MLVGDPAFAAQLHTDDGRVLHFDDPGCLLRHEPELDSGVRARWFRHHAEDRWLSGAAVVLVPVEQPTPMGYGLGAAERGTPEGLELEAARARVLARGGS